MTAQRTTASLKVGSAASLSATAPRGQRRASAGLASPWSRLLVPEDEWSSAQLHLTVYEATSEPTDTGLLDEYGFPIIVEYTKEPIGFIHFEE